MLACETKTKDKFCRHVYSNIPKEMGRVHGVEKTKQTKVLVLGLCKRTKGGGVRERLVILIQ